MCTDLNCLLVFLFLILHIINDTNPLALHIKKRKDFDILYLILYTLKGLNLIYLYEQF